MPNYDYRVEVHPDMYDAPDDVSVPDSIHFQAEITVGSSVEEDVGRLQELATAMGEGAEEALYQKLRELQEADHAE